MPDATEKKMGDLVQISVPGSPNYLGRYERRGHSATGPLDYVTPYNARRGGWGGWNRSPNSYSPTFIGPITDPALLRLAQAIEVTAADAPKDS